MKVNFLKMHGLGNDFVIVDARKSPLSFTSQQLQHIADRRFGVGCDQVIVLEPSDQADVFMRIYNPDASESSACGNATRCVAWLLMEETGKVATTVETKAGILPCEKAGDHLVRVDMGIPQFDWQKVPLASMQDTLAVNITEGELSTPVTLSMGNPHAVFFVPDTDAVPLAELGPKLEQNALFPERANISVAQVISKNHIKLTVWERGAGLTLACGTAACAALAAAHSLGLNGAQAQVDLPGGTLEIDWRKVQDGHIWMTGAVETVFQGELSL